jgi:hypothetical protein
MPFEISEHYRVGVKRAFPRRIHAIRDNENLIFSAGGVLNAHRAAFVNIHDTVKGATYWNIDEFL